MLVVPPPQRVRPPIAHRYRQQLINTPLLVRKEECIDV
jgi:hypothetical protein